MLRKIALALGLCAAASIALVVVQPAEFAKGLAVLKTLAEAKAAPAIRVTLFFLEDEAQTEDALRAARDLGVERAIMRLPVEEARVLASLDRYGEMAARS